MRMKNVPRNGYQIEILRFDDCSLICVNDRTEPEQHEKKGKKTNKERGRDHWILVSGSLVKPLSKRSSQDRCSIDQFWPANYLLFLCLFRGANGDNRQCKHAALCVPMPQDMKPFNQPRSQAREGQSQSVPRCCWSAVAGVRIRTQLSKQRKREKGSEERCPGISQNAVRCILQRASHSFASN